MTNGVFSEYELREMGIKFSDAEAYQSADCVGSCEEEMEAKVVTKSCRGTVIKTRVKGTGNGTLNVSMHCPLEIYNEMYGMNLDTLVEGVKAYGRNSVHKTFAITQHVFDEDGVEKFKAYPSLLLFCLCKGLNRMSHCNSVESAFDNEFFFCHDFFIIQMCTNICSIQN